uniref:Uncharacterized protein n=1 Tax=Chromera velia CCMP2878 TaxID=1169474 RepID=A0A0G4G792_9ALVE|eukprot:Cvel_4268.t1-p1 / transcript=Cvel_4268.t1 / gene=Cvel_4268 / organism=Chromera_velia_CCMP2878 / gene_product=hypothetical protein / transcript_product=hypothetical protein / location=Cvel_scaffold185:13427-13817(+) / protein_length=85 / sequence_SO=supercontig / SO=protein_coding / is_pseudo=false
MVQGPVKSKKSDAKSMTQRKNMPKKSQFKNPSAPRVKPRKESKIVKIGKIETQLAGVLDTANERLDIVKTKVPNQQQQQKKKGKK